MSTATFFKKGSQPPQETLIPGLNSGYSEGMKLPPLYLIDSYGLIYRSYFAFLTRPLRNPKGQNVSALFGFARTLVSLIDEGAPAAGSD
jgi:hypothetical protein